MKIFVVLLTLFVLFGGVAYASPKDGEITTYVVKDPGGGGR